MATFSNQGFKFTAGPTGTYTPLNQGITIPDRVYTVGDIIQANFLNIAGDYRFVGYEEGTEYPIFQHVGSDRHSIPHNLGATDSLTITGTIITDRPLGIGEVTFSSYGQRIDSGIGDGGFRIQAGLEVKFPQGVYNAGDPVTLDIEVLGDVATTFLGYESDTGNPVFRNTAGTRLYVLTNENLQHDAVYTVDNFVSIDAYTTCFAPGTLIATPAGERAVETLKPGDMVLTADGDTVPVRFVGFQKVPTLFGARELTHPVRIRAGALGRNTPHTDLVVTKDHGMIVDGVICHAGALINGTSITEVPTAELGRVATYYHVETEGHVPLLANGAVAESFIDQVDRAAFANHGEFVAMYGARVPAMTEMNLPRAMSMRQVPQGIWTRLDKRAAIIMAPSWVRRLRGVCEALVKYLFQGGLRDRVLSTGHRLARGPKNVA